MVDCYITPGWREELRVKFFSNKKKTIQSFALSYGCDQTQSTLHVLVCQGLRSRVTGLPTRLNFKALRCI